MSWIGTIVPECLNIVTRVQILWLEPRLILRDSVALVGRITTGVQIYLPVWKLKTRFSS